MKMNADQLRKLSPKDQETKKKVQSMKKNPIVFVLEDIYDTYNVGGLFRLADALAVEKVFLCGTTQTPPNSRIKKASIGTDKIVSWEYAKSAVEAVYAEKVRYGAIDKKPVQVVAVEQSTGSTAYDTIKYSTPLILIFGNETYGVKKETLELADHIAEIPMFGVNKSLNVIVSAAIVSYFVSQKVKLITR